MREFPPEEELRFLVGKTPIQFVIGRRKLDLQLEESCLIVMENRVSFVDAAGRRMEHVLAEEYGPDAIDFHKVLGARIIEIRREPFVLTLVLDNGTSFAIHSDEGPYESGHIGFSHPNGEGDMIVF